MLYQLGYLIEGGINAKLIVYVDVIVNQAEFVYASFVSCLPKNKARVNANV